MIIFATAPVMMQTFQTYPRLTLHLPTSQQHALEIVNKIVNKQCLCLCLPVSADLTINHLKSTFRQITSDYMTSTSASNICGVTAISSSSFPQKSWKSSQFTFFWHLGTKLGEKLGTNIIMHIMEVHSYVRTAYTAQLLLHVFLFYRRYVFFLNILEILHKY